MLYVREIYLLLLIQIKCKNNEIWHQYEDTSYDQN